MSSERAIQALREHRAAESEAKQRDVARAIEAISHRNGRLSIAAVAREAGVSREFIHSHDHLRASIISAASAATSQLQQRFDAAEDAASRSMSADRLTLTAEIRRLRSLVSERDGEIEQLRELRKRWLGAQLADPARIDPEMFAELHATNERLLTENNSLQSEVTSLRRLATELQSDLAAARQALSEELAASSGSETVTAFRPRASN